MLKVCHIISGDLWAGAEVMAYNLLKALKKYPDLELSAIILNEGKLADEIRKIGITVAIVDEKRLSFLQILNGVKKIIQERRPLIIHTHRYKENVLAYFVSRTAKEIKLIGTQHIAPEFLENKKTLRIIFLSYINFILRLLYFRRIVAVSETGRKYLHHNIPKNKVSMIHNGIEMPENLPARRNPGTFIIGSAGRLVPIKNYSFMIEVAREVLKNTDNIHFELVGTGPEEKKLKALIQKYGLKDRFSLNGFTENMQIFYSGLDLYINTSLYEGLPMTVLEAMACSIPVIAPNMGGLSEIIEDGAQGYLLSTHDPKDFAEKCLQLYHDTALRKRMGLSARNRVVSEFSASRMAEEYHQLYLQL